MRIGKLRAVAFFLAAMMAISVFAGCGAGTKTGTGSSETTVASEAETSQATTAKPTEENKPVALNLLIFKDTLKAGVQAQIDAIQDKYNITTKVEEIPGAPEGDNVIRTRAATNDLGDLLFWYCGANFPSVNPEGSLTDITNEPFLANVEDSYKPLVSVKDKIFGVPVGPANAGGIVYNRKVTAELGLSVPKTWDEFIANCEKVKAAGKIPVLASYKDPWTSQLLWLADFYNVNKAAPTFAADYTANKAKMATTPAMLRSFEKLSEVNKKGLMNKDFMSLTYDGATQLIAEGKAAYYPMATWWMSNLIEKYPEAVNDIGIFAEPSDDPNVNGITMWMPWAWFIPKTTTNLEASKKWLEYMASPEGVSTYIKAEKPTGPFVIKGITLPDDSYPIVKETMAYVDRGNVFPALEFVCPVKGANTAAICVEGGSGMKDAKATAESIDKDNEKYAKQLKLPGW